MRMMLTTFLVSLAHRLNGGTAYANPFATPALQKHFVVDIRGRSITWRVDGGAGETTTVDEEVTGAIGVIAGPGCTAQFANLRITARP